MRRREFVTLIGSAALTWPLATLDDDPVLFPLTDEQVDLLARHRGVRPSSYVPATM